MKRNHWVRSLQVNQSIFNPEYVYGVRISLVLDLYPGLASN